MKHNLDVIDMMDKKISLGENVMLGQTDACKENSEKNLKDSKEILMMLNDRQNNFMARHVAMMNSTSSIIQNIFSTVRNLEIELFKTNRKIEGMLDTI
jgi:Fic family protein